MHSNASLDHILKERERIAEELGIPSKLDKNSTTFDVFKSLTLRLETLRTWAC